MRHVLADLEDARHEAEQIIAEGVSTRLPLALSRLAIQTMLCQRGVEMPRDLLAWVSGGFTSDTMVKNWMSPTGG